MFRKDSILYHFHIYPKNGEKYLNLGEWFFFKENIIKKNGNSIVLCAKQDRELNYYNHWEFNINNKKFELYSKFYEELDDKRSSLIYSVDSFYEVLEYCCKDDGVFTSKL